MRNLLLLGLALELVGCSSAATGELSDVTLLGVRLQVDGDPERATPNVGETVTASWLALAQEESSRRGWRFSACMGQIDASGAARCSEAPFATAAEEPSTEAPRFQFKIPRGTRVSPGDRLLLAAAECSEDTPLELSPDKPEPRCPGRLLGTAETAVYQFELGVDGVNHQPSFDRTPVLRQGRPWSAERSDGCGDPGIDTIRAGSEPVPVTFAVDPDSRETVADRQSLESLSVLHFATAGAFEQPVTTLDGDEQKVVATWLPPPSFSVPTAGSVVRFGFVLFDGRGGADFAERSLCVMP
jgi:hypothetical protein